MKHIFRTILLCLAGFWVIFLGYYAYILTTDTLGLPFQGQERQSGNFLEFVVAKPRFLLSGYDRNVIDHDALIGALSLDGKPFDPTISGEGQIIISGEYVFISSNKMTGSSILKVDASEYNATKSTTYRLPRDMVLTESKNPKELVINGFNEQRDRTYKIRLIWYGELRTSDIRWYKHTDPQKNCLVQDAWDSLTFDPIQTTILESNTNGQIQTATTHLDFDPNVSRLCIIAGIGWDFYTVEDRYLETFTATGEVIDVLSPEYNMDSRVDFTFSTDIFLDRGDLYSKEYLSYRKNQKTLFLKSLDIRPNIALTEDNVILSPWKATIVAPFKEWQKYNISLNGITDIYGRSTDLRMDFVPIRTPFLSIGLTQGKTMFRYGDSIDAKLFSLKTPRQEYPLMLCQISLEWYSKAERIIAENTKKYTDDIYDILSSKDISGCIKKSILISDDTNISPFDIRGFSPTGTIRPGLYILAFAQKDDVLAFDRFVAPRVFSVVDTHIVVKVDASGKTEVLATDITTWAPRAEQSINLMQNIHQAYTEEWNSQTQSYDREYLPIDTKYFSKEIPAGKTKSWWLLSFERDNLVENDYNTLYGLSQEPYWDYEWRYNSFLLTASGGGHFGYVVSTWNDGITGWNFGLKDSDYSWESRPEYSTYIHTDRRLYLPGDTVYIHAIIRKNDSKLTIPRDTTFQLRVSDPLGDVLTETVLKANDYGSLGTWFLLPADARLGSYSVNIEPLENTWSFYMMSNSWTNFQVEVFKNPTFTADVTLRSPDIEDGTLMNLRELPNTDTAYPWYENKFESTFSLEGIVKAKYYNGQEIRNLPFTYRIYRNEYYDNSYWNDCFWWCFYQPSPEFYTEWTGTIDSDGFWFFRLPVEFTSYYSDYMYTAEVILVDPMTWEEVVTPATLLSRIPEKYKLYSMDNPLVFFPDKRILSQWEKISWPLSPRYGDWNLSLADNYQYELVSRNYSQVPVDDLRLSNITITSFDETIIQSGAITSSGLTIDTKWLKSGEYHIRIKPITTNEEFLPEYAITENVIYIVWDFTTKSNNIQVIPEKTIYTIGETARVLITFPFTTGYVYLTREKWWVLESEYVQIQGNTMIKEYKIDDTSVPNMYIGAVALSSTVGTWSRSYAVGYSEIVTDLADKKAKLTVDTNKTVYMNGENVDVALTLSDKNGNPLEWEVTMMVVDESLIRLLGNIDLDIIPKFFQKFPFTMKTSLTAIWMERNRFLSRKWSNGGSGDKWGWSVQIASRSLFKNTAYYNPSIRTDKTGRAKVNFKLPDNITDYRIIAIANTKISQFWVAEKTLSVRKDYTLEAHIPMIAYPGDTFTVTASAFNATKKVTKAQVVLTVGSGAGGYQAIEEVIMNPNESKAVSFSLTARDAWKGKLPYKITLIEWENVLDSIAKNMDILNIPLIESTERRFGVFSTGTRLSLELSDIWNMSLLKSRVTVRISSSLLVWLDSAIQSLLSYPYGCIEQTIASTLPNALALKFSDILGTTIDTEVAKKNLSEGVKKILRMQQFGWWKYWETDTEIHPHVTPYVVRSLFLFQELGVTIPKSSLDAGVKYIEDMVDYRADLYQNDPDFAAEIFWTLSKAKSKHADIIKKMIDEKKLTRHGYLAYAYGLHTLSGYTLGVDKKLETLMNENKSSYWYWSDGADEAIYAQLLIDRGEIERATKILDARIRSVDLSSYYVSTQEKIQLLYALLKHTLVSGAKWNEQIALRGDSLIADLSLTKNRISQKVEAPRGKMGDTISLTRSASKAPLYYEILEYNVPDDIYDTPARSALGMGVTREFEKIDESRGISKNGEYIGATPVEELIFEKGQLYRVNIHVKIPNERATWQHLTVEDFIPGAWRPIRSIFKTESAMNAWSDSEYDWANYWSYTEAKNDRILATVESWYGTTRTYSYYFRPDYAGSYLLPPVTSYFMYMPEFHAIGEYQKIIVK
jgi:uncharacterized protein YfaS (alpha-2-macroglobulin family)